VILPNLSGVPAERYNLTCVVCKKSTGVCLKCSDSSGCPNASHVLCAREKGLQMSIIPTAETLKGYRYVYLLHEISFFFALTLEHIILQLSTSLY
jgi:hypothetical protein